MESLQKWVKIPIWGNSFIITARKRSCGKVMFLHLSVILFTGGGVSQHAMGGGVHPLGRHPPETATEARVTHPTGMHSCFQ